MTATYFGGQTYDTYTAPGANIMKWNDSAYSNFVCPGSGLQNVADMGVFCYQDAGGGPYLYHVRLSVYSIEGHLICSSPDMETPEEGSAAWTTCLPANMSPANPQLTGGTSYVIAVQVESYAGMLAKSNLSNASESQASTFASGPPANLPSPGTDSAVYAARVGIDVTSYIKTIQGLAKASVKTVDGLAIASVKTIQGLG
jgi:hypothetical protein